MNSGTVLDLYWDWSPMETGSPFHYRNDFLVSLVLMSISPVSTIVFPNSETAMLSSPMAWGVKAFDFLSCLPQDIASDEFPQETCILYICIR